MSRHVIPKQEFVTSAIKVALYKDLILKTQKSVEVELKVVSYTVTYEKIFCRQEENTKWKRKTD